MKINEFIAHDEYMGRYSKYKLWAESINGSNKEIVSSQAKKKKNSYINYYIVPADDAVYKNPSQTKTPFQMYPKVLMEFLDLAKCLEKEDNQETKAKLILQYCNRYGLFNIAGLYTTSVVSGSVGDYDFSANIESVMLSEAGLDSIVTYGTNEMIDITYFAYHFIPETWFRKHQYNDDDNLNDRYTGKEYEEIQSGLKYIIEENYYCESVLYAEKEIVKLNGNFKNWIKLMEDGVEPSTAIDDVSDLLVTGPVRLTIGCNDRWHLVWLYNNLIDALSIMFLVNIIEDKQRILYCKNENCGFPFIVNKDTQIYCSPSCRDAARFRRHYNKKKSLMNKKL